MPIQSLIHKLVAIPMVYDFAQALAGGAKAKRELAKEFALLPAEGKAIDVGGGTGIYRRLFPERWRYCCLDPDPQKLQGFRQKFPDDDAVEASACAMPIQSASFDLCIMICVSHHLTDEQFELALAEANRVLKVGGTFILADAVWRLENTRGKFLWSVDRGSCPKTEEGLRRAIERYFIIDHFHDWKAHHNYALFRCRKSEQTHTNS